MATGLPALEDKTSQTVINKDVEEGDGGNMNIGLYVLPFQPFGLVWLTTGQEGKRWTVLEKDIHLFGKYLSREKAEETNAPGCRA